jgi:hypothetical protein
VKELFLKSFFATYLTALKVRRYFVIIQSFLSDPIA